MEGKRVLRSITLKNILSFGPEGQTLNFEPLNVLIGPNGSGKSNLIDILGFLRTIPRDIASIFQQGKGIKDWLWKGTNVSEFFYVDSVWEYGETEFVRHELGLGLRENKPCVFGELIYKPENPGNEHGPAIFVFDWDKIHIGKAIFELEGSENTNLPKNFRHDQSILAQRRDTDRFPEMAYLGDQYSRIVLYRNWHFGRDSHVRMLQLASLRGDFLSEDATNLHQVLKRIFSVEGLKENLAEHLRTLSEDIQAVNLVDLREFTELNITETGGKTISAFRISDGVLRYLALLAVLCDPDPPPLICIEEPELGLHPDIIPTIAKLLIDASQRTQLIVTTHSADLVSALWEFPESVVVCERRESGTQLKRLDPVRLEKWLERYSLGELWLNGEIGGTRW